jgi:hypothetical protein
MFLAENRVNPKDRKIYPHFTTATDTKLVNRVFANVREIILKEILNSIGLD